MNVIAIVLIAFGAYVLLGGKRLFASVKGTLAGESPDLSSLVSPTHGMSIEQLVDYYAGKDVTALSDEDRQKLMAHLAQALQADPPGGYFGVALIPVELSAPGVFAWVPDSGCDNGGCLLIRQTAGERSELSYFVDPKRWYGTATPAVPGSNGRFGLMKKNLKGQTLTWFDKNAGALKGIGGAIVGGAGGFLAGGPAGAAAGASAGYKTGSRL